MPGPLSEAALLSVHGMPDIQQPFLIAAEDCLQPEDAWSLKSAGFTTMHGCSSSTLVQTISIINGLT